MLAEWTNETYYEAAASYFTPAASQQPASALTRFPLIHATLQDLYNFGHFADEGSWD